jgi:hypothetical protein
MISHIMAASRRSGAEPITSMASTTQTAITSRSHHTGSWTVVTLAPHLTGTLATRCHDT